MRRKSSELNIFSMSALDLFASALGAFILIMLILLPYYKKQQTTVPPTPQVCPVPTPIPQCPSCPAPAPVPICPSCPTPAPAPECPPMPTPTVKFADNLLVIEMSWTKRGDIDLYVETVDGTYSYQNKYISGKPGRLTLDNRKGGTSKSPAFEIWKSFKPTKGLYKVCYKYYAGDNGTIAVRGSLDKPTGPVVMPVKRLRKGQKVCPLKFKISTDYKYTLVSLD